MDFSVVFQIVDKVSAVWHAHRFAIIIIAGVVATVIRFTLEWRHSRTKTASTPTILTPTDEKSPLLPNSITEIQEKLLSQSETQAKSNGPRRVKGVRTLQKKGQEIQIARIQPHVFYFTLGGSTRALAEQFAKSFVLPDSGDRILQPEIHDLAEIDYDDYFISPPERSDGATASFYMILLPSYNIDTELSNFLGHLEETHHDFRIDTAPLSQLAGYSVFGFGDRQDWPSEAEGFCSQAVEVDKWMAKLTGRKRAFPLGMGDVKSDATDRLDEWQTGIRIICADLSLGKGLGEGVPGSGDPVESEDEGESDDDIVPSSLTKQSRSTKTPDLEDLKAPIPVDFTTTRSVSSKNQAPKPMVPKTSPTYASLTKQGYTIVGSHSGVKICRWTKSALRGRGSCYKFSFYGIASHRCMEATPSLSCSNKCVFCWRHGTNPVGTTWRWEVDPPEMIFAGIKEGHYKKVKMLRGIPGVRSERFAEAMTIRHCALSLVGEPIFYPHINELLAMLHKEHISSFLVCNAQHPDQLASLGPVTQLYVSIDASNKESLRRIDRPLHRDFWERFIRCMDILREKRFTHRTVFRLTLVKGFNIEEEATGYADLVERALPAFIEIKGVTYCGTSTAAGAGLTMQNVPFYEEVQAFVLALERTLKLRGLDYGISAEHAHSCCVLLADRKRFYRPSHSDGVERWHSLIDYEKFFACVESGASFRPEDYIGDPTPEWALWGNGGFDPRDVRVDRKGRPKVQ